MSPPPSYSSTPDTNHNTQSQPHSHPAPPSPQRQPSFRKRKSSTIIPLSTGGNVNAALNASTSVESLASASGSTAASSAASSSSSSTTTAVATASSANSIPFTPSTSPSRVYSAVFKPSDHEHEHQDDMDSLLATSPPSSEGISSKPHYSQHPLPYRSTPHDPHPSNMSDGILNYGTVSPLPPHMLSYSHLHSQKHELERRASDSSAAEEGEATPLMGDDADGTIAGKWYTGPLFVTGVKLLVLFVLFTGVVVGTFWYGIPKLDPGDKAMLKLPRSFADLQALNSLFQKYKERYPYRILACGVVSYLFVQTFTLPGSMYLSILFGAAYGMWYGLLLACLCDSCGSLLCYTLSAILAPPLLTLPFYRARVETWRTKIMGDPKKGKEVSWDGVAAFLIVLRIAPFPPHWIANFVAPHLGISMGLFWLTCFIGIAPVSVIHVTIGSSLDTMTSAADFHILSLRNILGLGAVVVAVLIPVGLKRIFKKDLGELGEAEEAIEEAGVIDETVDVPQVHTFHVGAGPGVGGGLGPIPVEVDEDGRVRRYQAVDSGVILAGPSEGDESLDLVQPPRGILSKGQGRKGKGRLEIIADVNEEEEEVDAASSATEEGDGLKIVSVSKGRSNGNKSKSGHQVSGGGKVKARGYGTMSVEPAVVRL